MIMVVNVIMWDQWRKWGFDLFALWLAGSIVDKSTKVIASRNCSRIKLKRADENENLKEGEFVGGVKNWWNLSIVCCFWMKLISVTYSTNADIPERP